MSIKHPNNAKFLKNFRKKFGQDALMNTVGVAMYNAAHMAALAIEKAGKLDTASLRENLKGISFKNIFVIRCQRIQIDLKRHTERHSNKNTRRKHTFVVISFSDLCPIEINFTENEKMINYTNLFE